LNGDEFTTTYSNLDSYGNTELITEVSSHGTRQTSLSYYIDEAKWIVSLKEDEARWVGGLTGGETIDRTYNANGMLINENKYNHLFEPGNTAGVTTNYTYYSTGDLETVTDANSHTTTFSDYYRGIPQLETKAELKTDQTGFITTSRVVNNRGFVTSQTDGRGNTTSYTHNDLGQLTNIDYPINDDTVINWTTTGRETTRGTNQYKEVKTFDGFGRLISIKTSDLAQNIVIEKVLQYDALGRTLFESYPNSLISGTNFQYDALGRTERITHPDTSFTQYNYVGSLQVDEINERGFTTSYFYRAFGDPSLKSLIEIRSPKNTTESINTVMTRDGIDRIQTVTQGGLTRTYYYTLKNFLWAIDNPESGMTVFEYDNVGNVTKKTQGECFYTIFVGGEYVQMSKMNGTIYHYDKLNRLSSVDHKQCSGLVDIFSEDEQDYVTEYKYDDNGNRTYEGKGQLTQKRERWLTFDKNNNLTRETFDYHNYNAVIEYSVNNLDALESMTYPSGRVITYAPDALGRATQVAPYVSLVSYHDSGLPSTIEYGNGITTSFTFDSRNWIETITAGSLVDLTYDYDFSGNISSITDGVTPSNSRAMTYDGLERLETANGIWGLGSFGYDDSGNLSSKTLGGTNYTYNYDPDNNRLISVSGPQNYNLAYDSVGHVLSGKDNQYYEYGPDNNLITALTDNGEHYYYYDARNLKSRKDLGNIYLYSNSDNLIGEYQFTVPINETETAQAWVKEYYYLGSMQVAMAERTPVPAPSAVPFLNVPANDDGYGNFTLSWGNATGDVQWYALEESVNGVNGYQVIYSGTDLSWALQSKADGSYYYRIRACNIDACGAYTEGSQAVVVVQHLTEAPTLSTPAMDYDGVYEITWGAVSGTVSSYQIEQATLSDFSDGTQVYSGTAQSKAISGQAEGTYYYRGRACNTRGCTDYSPAVTTRVEYPTTAPIIVTPADVTVEATGILTAVNLGSASAYDNVQTLEVFSDKIGPFEIGTHTITWTATNILGTSTATQKIIVQDTIAPDFVYLPLLDNEYIEATGEFTSVDWLAQEPALAIDIVDGEMSILPDLIGPFPVGSHDITWTATDLNGNSVSVVRTLHIVDTIPPDIKVSHIEVWSDVPVSIDIGTPSVSDLGGTTSLVSEGVLAEYSPGTTVVTWTATDASGNIAKRYQYVTVIASLANYHWGENQKIVLGTQQVNFKSRLVHDELGENMIFIPTLDSVSVFKKQTGWGYPISLTDDTDVQNFVINMSPSGKAIIAWELERNSELTYVKFYDPDTGFSEKETLNFSLNPCCGGGSAHGSIEMFNNGEAMIIGADDYSYTLDTLYSVRYLTEASVEFSPELAAGWQAKELIPLTPAEGDGSSDPNEYWWRNVYDIYSASNQNGQVVISWGQTPEGFNTPAYNFYEPGIGWGATTIMNGFGYLRTNKLDINNNGKVAGFTSDRFSYYMTGDDQLLFTDSTGQLSNKEFRIDFINSVVEFAHTDVLISEDDRAWHMADAAVRIFDPSSWYKHDMDANWILGYVEGQLTSTAPVYVNKDISHDRNNHDFFETKLAEDALGNQVTITQEWFFDEILGEDSDALLFNVNIAGLGWRGYRHVPDIPPHVDMLQDALFSAGSTTHLFYIDEDNELVHKRFGTGDLSVPVITPPPSVVVDSTGGLTSVTLGDAMTIDNVDGVLVATPDNAGPFPIGHHIVTWRAVDSADNVATAFQKVTVRETIAPVVSAPADIVVEAESIHTYVDLGQGTANDNWDGVLTPYPDQQGPFTVGTHTIIWTATDSFGNIGTATQTVEIRDTIAPELTIPGDLTLTSIDGQPMNVDIGQATATDIFAVTITNDAPSMFAVGSTIVTWVAEDENGQQSTAVQTVTVNPPPGWPVTVAGDDQYVAPGARVTLDGSLSYDSDGGSISSYSWSQLSGPTVRLRKPGNVSTSFTAPDVTATTELIFELVVTDNSGNSNYDRVSVFVEVNTPNNPPTANAGIDQTTTEGELVSLDGQLSADNDGSIISFSWQQISGPVVSLSGANTSVATFTAPDVTSSTVLSFELTVTDDLGETDTDTVLITVNNTPSGNLSPTANAGADQVVTEGHAVMLNGQLSSDSDGSISSYNWVQLSGPSVTLTSAKTTMPSFTAPLVSSSSDLTFELTVTDDQGAIDTDTVVVTVNDSSGGDTTPPVTSISYTRTSSKGNTFYDVSLQANEQATTSYRVTSGTILSGGTDTSNWQSYTGTINIRAPKKGNTVIEFYSQDSAGNTEIAQSVVLN